MKLERIRIIRIILLVLILTTLAFIFIQSAIPPEESEKESGAVGDAVTEIIPPTTAVGSFLKTNVRKIAHFVEYAALGLWVSLYGIITFPAPRRLSLIFPAGLFVALLDETLQILSHRGSSVADVWLDFLGFFTAAALVWGIYLLVIKNKREKKQS